MKLAMKFGKKIKFNLAIKKLRDYGREIEMGFNRCTLFGRLPKKTILIKRETPAWSNGNRSETIHPLS